jgi:hypothetical protein
LFLNRFSFLFRLRRIDGFQAAQRDVGVSSQKGEKQDGASGLNFLCPLARFRFLTFTDLEVESVVEFAVVAEPAAEAVAGLVLFGLDLRDDLKEREEACARPQLVP